MSDKLTRNEHIARALLLGRVYDWRDGSYCFVDSHYGLPQVRGSLDCETLEPMSNGKSNGRIKRIPNGNNPYKWEQWLIMPLPWEAPDK